MEIKGKEFIDWLHEIRKNHKRERERIGAKVWSMKIRKEVEAMIGHPITFIESDMSKIPKEIAR